MCHNNANSADTSFAHGSWCRYPDLRRYGRGQHPPGGSGAVRPVSHGKMAIPKKHDFEYEVPELFRIAAEKKGVFVNPALTEPFGLTLLEASATGLPIVATNDGGPQDIIHNCGNGILVDPINTKK